jgi:acetyltransferase
MRSQANPWAGPGDAQRGYHSLDVFFAPATVAVIGATEAPGRVGRAVLKNLLASPFGGTVFPVNPGRRSALGVRAYPAIAAVPLPVELAIIATPAPTVPGLIGECIDAGVKGAIIMAEGLEVSTPAGADLLQQIAGRLKGSPLRVLGPNSAGLACPRTRLNATFAPAMVPSGGIGFLSQSGSLLTALLSGELPRHIGASAFVSVGSLLDIGWAEWLSYLAADPYTECISIYMERLDDPRAFFAAVREVSPHQPVILVKGGRSPDDPAVDRAFDELCRSSGAVHVHRLADLFRMADILTSRPAASGRLAILTNARGPAVLAADELRAGGGRLAQPAPLTAAALADVLGARWDRQNPIDVGNDADLARFARASTLAAHDPNTDALLVLLAPQTSVDPVQAAEKLGGIAQAVGKPVLACWLWGAATPASLQVFREAGIPVFQSPEAAVSAFGYLWQHTVNQHGLTESTVGPAETAGERLNPDRAAGVLAAARWSGRTMLAEAEVRELMAAYALPMREARPAASGAEAVAAADALGYPVVLELAARDVCDDGEEVRLRAADAAAAREAFQTLKLVERVHFGTGPVRITVRQLIPPGEVQLALSCEAHPEFGPVIRLGKGGRVSEAPGRVATAIAPLAPMATRQLIEQCTALTGAFLGREEFDRAALEQFLLRFSRLVVEQPGIKEIWINPLRVSARRVAADSASVVLREPPTEERQSQQPAALGVVEVEVAVADGCS